MSTVFTQEWADAYNRRMKKYEADRKTSSAQPEPAVRHDPLPAAPREKGNPARRRVSVTSYRRRLLDPDNLCPKYALDSLRYLGVLEDDTAKHIELLVRQEKVKTKEEERTEIEITDIP